MDKRDVKEVMISLIVGFGVVYPTLAFTMLEYSPLEWDSTFRFLFVVLSLLVSRIFYSCKYE